VAVLPKRILIANRGEIAVRVARTIREMGIEPLGVFASSDAGAFHLGAMARSVDLGPGAAYLDVGRILGAARALDADAIHPGYGFLSENPGFARAVSDAGLLWIGPPPDAIEKMGDKLAARARMRAAGVPVVPGSDGSEIAGVPADSDDALASRAREIGYPVLVKASAGGGGKGMARVDRAEDLPGALAETRRVGQAAFADARVYLEKLFERPRHVEFQVFGDAHGNLVHLFERECSVQRRHQKVLEETPSLALDPRLREAMGRAAVEAARSVGYVGAGTVEFLLDEHNFYFLEMNTRLQVEHPITEETLGLDLVRAQIEIAAGALLPPEWRNGELSPRGHAIELRLYAEDPVEFLPRTGRILVWEEPSGPGVRVDAGVGEGSDVGLEFDPLLAKLVVSAPDRDGAIARARRAVSEWVVLGVETNAPLLSAVLESSDFRSGRYATDLVGSLDRQAAGDTPPSDAAWIAAALAFEDEDPGGLPAETAARRPRGGGDPWDAPSGWRAGE
jgi:acetyl/propionyl-CoA carboxylase alpha subunit